MLLETAVGCLLKHSTLPIRQEKYRLYTSCTVARFLHVIFSVSFCFEMSFISGTTGTALEQMDFNSGFPIDKKRF